MPTCFTSFGSRPSTCETRFWTSTAATSMSRSTSKVTVIVRRAVAAARRGHVLHALDAVDGLLDRRRDRRLDDLGARALVERVDRAPVGGASSGNCAIGSVGMAMRAGEDDDQRADARQNRASDEGVDNHRIGFAARALGLRAAGAQARAARSARRPAASATPETTTRSPGLMPSSTGIVVADDRADLDRALARHELAVRRPRRRRRSTGR